MAVDTPGAEPALWKIVSITDQLTFDPATGGGRTKRVTFRLFNGQTSYVDIPLTDFSAQTVTDKVQEHAEQLLEVLQAQGPALSNYGIERP